MCAAHFVSLWFLFFVCLSVPFLFPFVYLSVCLYLIPICHSFTVYLSFSFLLSALISPSLFLFPFSISFLLPPSLSIYLSFYLYQFVSLFLSIFFFLYQSICLSIYLSKLSFLFLYLFFLSIYFLSVYQFLFLLLSFSQTVCIFF
jgi:hypothetical protein